MQAAVDNHALVLANPDDNEMPEKRRKTAKSKPTCGACGKVVEAGLCHSSIKFVQSIPKDVSSLRIHSWYFV